MTPLTDEGLKEWYIQTTKHMVEKLSPRYSPDVAHALKWIMEEYAMLRKEYVAVEGMLADLQDHSNLYHKGREDGAKEGIAADRKRCADLASEAVWRAMLAGGVSSQDVVNAIRKLEDQIASGGGVAIVKGTT